MPWVLRVLWSSVYCSYSSRSNGCIGGIATPLPAAAKLPPPHPTPPLRCLRCPRAANASTSAMWSKRVSDLSGITTNSEPKWRSPSSGCWEGPADFGSLFITNFLRYGNIPIVVTLKSEIMLVSLWAMFLNAPHMK